MRFDAVAFLKGLFSSGSGIEPAHYFGTENDFASLPDPPPGLAPDDLNEEAHELWFERVSVIVEDGRLPLEHAEAKALADVLLVMGREGKNPLK